ncbi:hypothetical protein KBX06_00465 [Micromonospora sp. C31]|uniref:hypothetical protein n=1 Tax=Micromonospora sp. C31 TaxID=2824876 RepID=UPI001B35C8B3|nr:hypothetical protein [Micromonospora sp. C31]MBQ1071645.1 hypothetical protein [Micromonospora sp. C31]
MKSAKMILLGTAVALLLLGALSFVLQPGPPEPECAKAGAPTSGFVDDDNRDCAITIESYAEIRDYETSPKLFRIAGAGLVLAGLVVGVVGLVKRSRRPGDTAA